MAASPTSSFSSSPVAEALLSRARQLSSNAYERTRSAAPTAFAEGEDLLLPGSSSYHGRSSSSPSLSPVSVSTALHQRHRSSFNDFIRDHNKRRSSVQRLSSSSTTSSKAGCQGNNISSSPLVHGKETKASTSKEESCISPKDKQSTEDPASTSTSASAAVTIVVNQSTDESITLPSSTSPVTALSLSSSSQDNNNNNNDNNTQTPLVSSTTTTTTCHTSELPSNRPQQTLSIITRPRALTTESITTTTSCENSPCATATSTPYMPMDMHRKHRSESGNASGSGLVLGILEVLREGEQRRTLTEQEHATSTPSSSVPPKYAQDTTSDQERTQQQTYIVQPAQVPVLDTPEATQVSPTPQIPYTPPRATVSVSAPPATSTPTAPETTSPETDPVTESKVAAPNIPDNEPVPVPALAKAKNKTKLSVDTAFLHRKSRSQSVSTQGSVESVPSPTSATNATATTTTAIQTQANGQMQSPSVKQSRRSSKLFGKLVPKFLQTSFSPSNTAGGSSSPRSAFPASPSPLSAVTTTRPGRSASFTGGASGGLKGITSGSSSTLIGSIAEEASTDNKTSTVSSLPVNLPALPTSVVETAEDWLSGTQLNEHTPGQASATISALPPPPALSSRTASSYSNHSVRTNGSVRQAEEIIQSPAFNYKVEIEYQNQKQESHHHPMDAIADTPGDMPDTKEEEEESSYTIDENCDDDFFLNSVLRKKNTKSMGVQTPPTPLSTTKTETTSSWISSGRTPSLTNSLSSQTSSSGSPSPTSPQASTTATATVIFKTSPPVSATDAYNYDPQQYHHSQVRSRTLPTPGTHPGMDEKRSRLRDAVEEWRRTNSVNNGKGSLGSLLSSPSYASSAASAYTSLAV
ncbi:hypothetical protein BGX28_007823 [Mortierella sp. GBA30]|nr:hypothetical protein BGX28_007823 [Mortierella sp. GBA30]